MKMTHQILLNINY